MAATTDTHHFFAGKSGAADTAMVCAAAIAAVNVATLIALAGDGAP